MIEYLNVIRERPPKIKRGSIYLATVGLKIAVFTAADTAPNKWTRNWIKMTMYCIHHWHVKFSVKLITRRAALRRVCGEKRSYWLEQRTELKIGHLKEPEPNETSTLIVKQRLLHKKNKFTSVRPQLQTQKEGTVKCKAGKIQNRLGNH